MILTVKIIFSVEITPLQFIYLYFGG